MLAPCITHGLRNLSVFKFKQLTYKLNCFCVTMRSNSFYGSTRSLYYYIWVHEVTFNFCSELTWSLSTGYKKISQEVPLVQVRQKHFLFFFQEKPCECNSGLGRISREIVQYTVRVLYSLCTKNQSKSVTSSLATSSCRMDLRAFLHGSESLLKTEPYTRHSCNTVVLDMSSVPLCS